MNQTPNGTATTENPSDSVIKQALELRDKLSKFEGIDGDSSDFGCLIALGDIINPVRWTQSTYCKAAREALEKGDIQAAEKFYHDAKELQFRRGCTSALLMIVVAIAIVVAFVAYITHAH